MFLSPPELLKRRRQLRNYPTEAERRLWLVLRKRSLCGLKFRRQYSVGKYIVDFYCPSHRLAIEVDGGQHYTSERIAYDAQRTKFLNQRNIRVVRVTNAEVYWHLDEVIDYLTTIISKLTSVKK
ncbi:MAG: endonuclease domain-containing protein [Patescibacteria group bacterium]